MDNLPRYLKDSIPQWAILSPNIIESAYYQAYQQFDRIYEMTKDSIMNFSFLRYQPWWEDIAHRLNGQIMKGQILNFSKKLAVKRMRQIFNPSIFYLSQLDEIQVPAYG